MGMGSRLSQALDAKSMSQAELARASGVDEATISALIKRDSKRSEAAPALADALGLSLHWLLTGEGERDVRSYMVTEAAAPTDSEYGGSRYVMIKRLTAQVSAGGGEMVEHDEIQDYVAFRRDWLRKKGLNASQLVVVEVSGDSMSPTLEDGDVILVNVMDRSIRDGRIYAFRVHDEVRVKRFQHASDGGIVVTSDNKSPRYRDEQLSPDILERLDIIGRVVWGGGEI